MSGKIFFISDLHLGHENMAKNRGFPDAKSHDENLITQWNLRVHKKDTVYIMGDITMEKANYEILDRLLGYKKVVGGNHDNPNHTHRMLEHINSFGGCIVFRHKGYPKLWLTHIPIHPKELDMDKAKGTISYNIHGHIHDAYKMDDPRYINVSAEVIDYIPKTIEELLNEK